MKPHRFNKKSGGNFLRRVRVLSNLTQEQAAKKLKLSRSHLTNLELGKRTIGTWKQFTSICNTYSIQPTTLIAWYYPTFQ